MRSPDIAVLFLSAIVLPLCVMVVTILLVMVVSDRRRIRALAERVRLVERELARGLRPPAASGAAGAPPAVPTAAPAGSTIPGTVSDRAPAGGGSAATRLAAPAAGDPFAPAPPVDGGGLLSGWREAVRVWLLGGNVVVRIGVVILFFGVAFLLNYVAEQGWLPTELRLVAAALGGVALLAVGWRLRTTRRDYALALQGGGAGIVYLTVFAAVNLYARLGPGPGLALMAGLAFAGAALAVVQDARILAVLATLGGLLAPVLVSGEAGHVALFSYYAALDAGVLAVAWYRAWRGLNVLAFVFTVLVGAAWGHSSYRPELFWTTEPFLVLFFFFFVAVAVLFAWRRAPRLTGYVDGTLVFGVPAAAFALQRPLVEPFEYGLAWSTVVLAFVYAALASWLARQRRASLPRLVEAFAAIAVVAGTLAIPLAVDNRWTSAAWALEGVALAWVGLRQTKTLAVVNGVALQLVAGALVLLDTGRPAGPLPVVNVVYLGGLMLAGAGLATAWMLARSRRRGIGPAVLRGAHLGWAILAWGLAWWFYAGFEEMARVLPSGVRPAAQLVLVASSFGVLAWLRHRLDWSQLAWPPSLLLPGLGWFALLWWFRESHVLAGWGAGAWPLGLVMHYLVLRRLESDWARGATYVHRATLWLVTALASWECHWAVARLAPPGPAWESMGVVLVPLAVIWGGRRFGHRVGWPVRRFPEAYLGAGQRPIVAAVALWGLVSSFLPGDPRPLRYLPLLNPLELVQGIALGVMGWWIATGVDRQRVALWSGWGALGFVVLNGVVARAVHFLGGVPFRPDALWASATYQTAVSIVWATVALVVMLGATRFAYRTCWFAGAALLAAVVAKLFLVDLADVGTVARIVSFLAVGLLTLVIGYVAPLPPRRMNGQPPEHP